MLMSTTEVGTQKWRMVKLELLCVLGIAFLILHVDASSRAPHGKSGHRELLLRTKRSITKLPQSDLSADELPASGFGGLPAESLRHVDVYSQPRQVLHAEALFCSGNCYQSRAKPKSDPPSDSLDGPKYSYLPGPPPK